MAIRFKAWVLAPMFCLLAPPVMAEESNSYVAINVGQSQGKNACKSPWIPLGTPCTENFIAYRLAYGYQFTPTWGFELSYGDLAFAEAKGSVATPPLPATGPATYTWSLKAMGWSVAGTGTLNLADRLYLIGKLGLVRADFREDLTLHATNGAFQGVGMVNTAMTHLTYGAAIQYEVAPSVALRAQYENFGSYDLYGTYGVAPPKVSLSMISGSVVFKF